MAPKNPIISKEDSLTKKRDSIKARFASFKKYLTNLQDEIKAGTNLTETKLIELEQRSLKAEQVLVEYEEVQTEIECVVSDCEEQYRQREAFEEEYFAVIAISKHLLNTNANREGGSDNSERASNINSQGQVVQGVKLPTIQLPAFSGSYEEWLEFRDTFESLINSNASISQIQKFHYLKASLLEGAAQVISSIEFTANNYAVAWDILQKRYDNSRLLIDNHVKALFNLEQIQRESSKKLRNLIDSINKHLRSLKQLNQPTEYWDTIIIHLVATKLDNVTSRQWEEFKSKHENPTLDNLRTFLKGRADVLETIEFNQGDKKQTRKDLNNTKGFFTSKQKCPFCKKEHFIYKCEGFLKLGIADKLKAVKALKLCINCLRAGHFIDSCKFGKCQKCNEKHNTLLHNEATLNTESKNQQGTQITLNSCHATSHVLLSTARVKILDRNGSLQIARALLDSGSQSTFITSSLCNKLRLPTSNFQLQVVGLNQTNSACNKKCEIQLYSSQNKFQCVLSAFVIDTITDELPNRRINKASLQIPKNIHLADPDFNEPDKIDILIGADMFWSLMCTERITLGRNEPVLQETKLGWIVAGPIGYCKLDRTLCNFSKNADIQKQLARFWEIEECPGEVVRSEEESECEAHFTKTTRRTEDGRFIVSIPFRESPAIVGESKSRAQKCLITLERRLQSNEILRQRYIDFLDEYLALGHMSKVDDDTSHAYYMPHHGVAREESETTKLRVVFNASSPTSTSFSLNSIQMNGPTLQEDLLSIILNFRKHSIVISADITKMYRQILVEPKQRALQRILWRTDPTQPVDTYELNTVTYGTTAASFLSVRCLMQLASECEKTLPEISKIIKTNMYVDDLLTGTDSVEQARKIAIQISDVLKGGGFELAKWRSNKPEAIRNISKNTMILDSHDFGEETAKTLGLRWSCGPDHLLYTVNTIHSKGPITKRTILSCTARIFDPLGLLSPVIISIKILLQRLWLEKLSWDEPVPPHIQAIWSRFSEELKFLNDIRIPRHALCMNPTQVEVHGFSDASESAYGACIFIRSINERGEISVQLLCAKSKVAPLKSLTIPKLELCGALILARLFDKVKHSLELEFTRSVLWTDSSIVLAWLKTTPNMLKTFVNNRVAEIQAKTKSTDWRHVPSANNPADIASRGTNPSSMKDLKLWWKGPKWLSNPESEWPESVINHEKMKIPEVREKIKALCAFKSDYDFPFERFSSSGKLIRTVAYMLRFRNNFKSKTVGHLSTKELETALNAIIRLVQIKNFNVEYNDLMNGKALKSKSNILSLNPFLDENKLIRVGGRLTNSTFSTDKKYPILLPKNHILVKLIFENEHKRLLHAGPQLLLAKIRERFWPISGRNSAKQAVRNCVRCFRFNPQVAQPIMGNLPAARLIARCPFDTSGVDYAGPFSVKDRKGRGSRISKCWMCLFVCFATKAVHLEIVSELSAQSFMQALRRFIARRGRPSKIYSDNGTNFVGASREITELFDFLNANETSLSEAFVSEGIDWSFIPANSPHFGGLWEAGIRSSKHHLKRVLGSANLTYEELSTLVAQIEAILNSRPLTPLSSDPNDLLPLTPAHFLIGRPILSVPDYDFSQVNESRLDKYQRIQAMKNHFWQRWKTEYVSELQQRCKWKKNQNLLQTDDLVLIKEDNVPPMCWKLGRVIQLHPGRDSIPRVATIRTNRGLVKRSFAKLCPLPRDNLESQCFQPGGHVDEDTKAADSACASRVSFQPKEKSEQTPTSSRSE